MSTISPNFIAVTPDRVLRMDVANAQPARYYAKNGVSPSLAKSVYLSTLK